MDEHDRTRRVLLNVQRDGCVPDHVEKTFFERLAPQGPFADAWEAWETAQRVINHDEDRFYCSGAEADPDRFLRLVRLVRADQWHYLLEVAEPGAIVELQSQFGLSGAVWADGLTEGQRRMLCAALTRELHIGQPRRIAWVADADEMGPVHHPVREIVNRLGLEGWEHGSWALILQYKRGDLADTLHVPRALDGMSSPAFLVQTDCTAASGITQPNAQAAAGAVGFAEAVHRSCTVAVHEVELLPLDGS